MASIRWRHYVKHFILTSEEIEKQDRKRWANIKIRPTVKKKKTPPKRGCPYSYEDSLII